MSLTLRTDFGCTEAVIDGDGGLRRFYQITSILTDHLQVAFTGKEDEFDAINWNFSMGRYRLTLQYSIYSGIVLFPTLAQNAHKKENKAVVELANVLEGKLQNMDLKHLILGPTPAEQ